MCSVCERHFDSQFIEKFYRTIIQGQEVLTPRFRPVLSKDAVPTIFPNLPKYLSKPVPKKRSVQRVSDQYDSKRIKLSSSVITPDLKNEQLMKPILINEVCNVILPTQYWICIKYEESPNIICFSTWNAYSEKEIQPNKKIVVNKVSDCEILCTVYFNSVVVNTLKLNDSKELQVVLNNANEQFMCKGIGTVQEFHGPRNLKNLITENNCLRYKSCSGVVSKVRNSCTACKYQRKLMLNRLYYFKKSHVKSRKLMPNNKLKVSQKTTKRLKQRAIKLCNTLKTMKCKQKLHLNNHMSEKLAALTYKQQLAFGEFFKDASRKNTRGMLYNKEWILESIIMRMKSPRLYEHIRINKILILPSRSCIKKSLTTYRSGFGFNQKTFENLKIKVEDLDEYKSHGCILFDEMKLSENLQLQANGKIQGYVDYGSFTPADKKHALCDHGLVLMFQPFVGEWTQILGVFGTKGNVKGAMLGKLLIEAVILAEKAGLFVDCVTGDGATWNRAMWKDFGIGVSNDGKVKCKVPHPVNEERYLHFISDFPHLIKCLRNTLLKNGFKTPDGPVTIDFIRTAWKEDERAVRLKAMPKITKVHLYPNNFEKMRVNFAFQLFSTEVLKGLYIYNDVVSAQCGNPKPIVNFIKTINELIEIMTSRVYGKGLKHGSPKCDKLGRFLQYLDAWEVHCGGEFGFLSKSTAVGLRVTIASTLSLIEYLTNKVKYSYILTSRLTQDKIENLFGIIRQCKGCNDHPTSAEFLVIVECLSFYNLARPPRGANAQPSIIKSLIVTSAEKSKSPSLSALDTLVEGGNLTEVATILSNCAKNPASQHNQMIKQESDERLIFYIAGYAVRKFKKKTACESCKLILQHDNETDLIPAAEFVAHFDKGGLSYPSNSMYHLIYQIERKFTKCFSLNNLHQDSVLDIIATLSESTLIRVGCIKHQIELTQKIVKFFVMTRLHFYLKGVNRNRTYKRDRQKFLKMRRCN